jgi:hypothetical protein
MNNLLSDLSKILISATTIGLQFLCIGVIVQLLINTTILGWNPVANIQAAGPSFTGVIAFVVLYLLFTNKKD